MLEHWCAQQTVSAVDPLNNPFLLSALEVWARLVAKNNGLSNGQIREISDREPTLGLLGQFITLQLGTIILQ